jgi:hypothetical protein
MELTFASIKMAKLVLLRADPCYDGGQMTSGKG